MKFTVDMNNLILFSVEGSECHAFGMLGISHLEKEGFCETHPKSWESCFHIPSHHT